MILARATSAAPAAYRWTRDEYYRLGELGFLQECRVELINGEIIDLGRVSPPHAAAVTAGAGLLRNHFGSGYYVRMQQPLQVGTSSDPLPDLAVVTGTPRQYLAAHPTTAALVVEVADVTLRYDRTVKSALYAAAGIPDYWVLNLVGRQLEVFRDPEPDPAVPGAYHYATTVILKPGDVARPLAMPQASIAVAELLP